MNLLFLLLLCLSTADALEPHSYIGTHLKMTYMDFEHGYGNELFRKQSLGPNFYIGHRVNEFMGIEIGYEKFYTKPNNCSYQSALKGECELTKDSIPTYSSSSTPYSLGTPINECLLPFSCEGKGKIKGPYIGVVGYYSPRENSDLELIGSVGISCLKAHYERHLKVVGGIPYSSSRKFKGSKKVPRIMGGFQYRLSEHLKFRAGIGWINSKRLDIVVNDEYMGSLIPQVKPKNINFWEMGILYNFD